MGDDHRRRLRGRRRCRSGFHAQRCCLRCRALQGDVAASRQDLQIEPPQAFGAMPTSGYADDPVNVGTGNFVEPEVDLAFAGGCASLAFTRMYNSLDSGAGLFGAGWSSILEQTVEFTDTGASWHMSDGRRVVFPRFSEDGTAAAIGENYWLASEDAQLLVRDNQGAWHRFSLAGQWLGSGSGAGTAIEVLRDHTGLVTELRHERGRSIQVCYRDQQVAGLRASDGRQVSYSYDDRHRLVGVTTETGTRHYRWTDTDLIDQVVSATGVVEAENTYDDQRRISTQRSPFGRVSRYAYLPGGVTVVSDAEGNESNIWITDPRGRLVSVVDSDDARQSLSYDRQGNLVMVTARDGAVTVHSYDARGRRLRTVTAGGADLQWEYDDADRVTAVITASGAFTQYRYHNADRNPSTMIDPTGGITEMTWSQGLLTRIVDGGRNTDFYTCESKATGLLKAGDRRWVSYPGGSTSDMWDSERQPSD